MRRMTTAATFLVLLALAAGCSHFSARHLPREPLGRDQARTLTMNFLAFSYQTVAMRQGFGVRGEALLRDAVPDWAGWFDDLWLGAYVSDSRGRILAQDGRTFSPRPADRAQGLPFDFILVPGEEVEGPLYLSFGYRMVLTRDQSGPGDRGPFFASETAVTQ